MKNVAVLVFACDRYELLYKGFDFFFKKNWDHSFPITKYFTTESKNIDLVGYTHLKSGYGEWTNRLKLILDQIEEDYIIFLQEDVWFNKKISPGVLELILINMVKNELKLVKLNSSEVYTTEELDVHFKGYALARVIKESSDFLMSHQISIWNKNFFYAQLKDNEHPWRNERRGTKRLRKSNDDIYQIDLLSENGKPPINKNSSDIIQGEYHTISVNACIQSNTKIFIPELEKDLPEYADKIRYNMENNITHDGKPKPRKEDIFKKIKNIVRSLSNRDRP
jgi:hypothetical protein